MRPLGRGRESQESEEEPIKQKVNTGNREMFLPSISPVQSPQWVCADSKPGTWNSIQPVPCFPARTAPALPQSPLLSLRPVVRNSNIQERGHTDRTRLPPQGISHPVRAPACSRLLPVAWGNMPRQNTKLQPGVEGEVPTICSTKKQIPLAPPSQTAWMEMKTGSPGIPAPAASFSVSDRGSCAECTDSPAPEHQRAYPLQRKWVLAGHPPP